MEHPVQNESRTPCSANLDASFAPTLHSARFDASHLNDTPAPHDASHLNDSPAPHDASRLNDTPAPYDASHLNNSPAPHDASDSHDASARFDASHLNDTPAPYDASASHDVSAPHDASDSHDTPARFDASHLNNSPAPYDASASYDTPAPIDASHLNNSSAPHDASHLNDTPARFDASDSHDASARFDKSALKGCISAHDASSFHEKPTPNIAASSVVLVALYVAAQMLADVGSLKIALVAGMCVDGGTFIYPLTFTLRDMVHKKMGKTVAKTLVIASAVINVCMVAFFALLTLLPQDPSWAKQESWSAIFATVWRIALASIVAELAGELSDTEIYHLWVTRVTVRHEWSRVVVSNALSIPLDTLIFVFAAFWRTMPFSSLWSIVASNIAVKAAVTLISIPLIYTVRDGDVRSM